jgi:sec-independent protein translocase protein TatA
MKSSDLYKRDAACMSIMPELLTMTPLFINLGVPELSIIVLLVLILFGPGKLPGVMKSLGDGVRQFKDSSNGTHRPSVEQVYQAPPQQQAALPSTTPQNLSAPPSEAQLAAAQRTEHAHTPL